MGSRGDGEMGRGGRQGEKSERRFPTIRTSERKIATLSTLSTLSSSHAQCPMPHAPLTINQNAELWRRQIQNILRVQQAVLAIVLNRR